MPVSSRTRRIVGWLLLALALLLVITGLGITEARWVGYLTFGILGKALSFQLHSLLWIPFLAVLVLHLAISCRART
jgi:thiosulfate reductase cytochrome b subunit